MKRLFQAVRLPALALVLATPVALAHIPLTQSIVDDAFREIAAARTAIAEAKNDDAKAAAVYELAIEATKLMDLLNQEIRLHGTEQLDLLHDTVITATSRGIEIIWSQDHERYFYTGAAYADYLGLQPEGLNAANSLFHLIETGFYLGDPGDRNGLLERVALERDYLERFPGIGDSGEVAMFLAIDYRDLWRLCRKAEDIACTDRYAALNREHLEATIAGKDERASKLARSFLTRFEAEVASAD